MVGIKNKKLTNLQLELLDLFAYELEDNQLQEAKQLLINYLADQVSDGIDAFFEENNLDEQKLDEWEEEHLRTPYKEGQEN